MKSKIWVIIPAFNESKYIQPVLKKVLNVWPQVVVVDDGSSDDTYQQAAGVASHVLRHKVNLGKGSALKTGSEYAFSELDAEGVIFFDADDQHDPSLIPAFAEHLERTPVVFGVRAFTNEMPLIRIMMNRLASVIILLFFGKYVPDIPSGYKALTKQAYDKINWQSTDYAVEMEIAARVAQHKLPFAEVPIPTIYHDLERGMTVLDIVHMIEKLLLWRIKS
jgi:polyprenyl-phospho-N-acetylgalactosaminyl synthase